MAVNPYQAPTTAPHVAPPSGGDPLYVDQSGRVRLLAGLLVAGAIMSLVSAGSTWLEIDLLVRASRGEVTLAEAEASDQRQLLVRILGLLVDIVTMVIFAMFLVRANKNARAVSGQPLEISPGWMVGWFFVPFANLFKPYVAVREVWERSKGAAPALLGVWWAAWVLSGVLSNVAWRMTDPNDSIPRLVSADRMVIASDLASLAACVLALWMVRSLHAGQVRHHQTGRPDLSGA